MTVVVTICVVDCVWFGSMNDARGYIVKRVLTETVVVVAVPETTTSAVDTTVIVTVPVEVSRTHEVLCCKEKGRVSDCVEAKVLLGEVDRKCANTFSVVRYNMGETYDIAGVTVCVMKSTQSWLRAAKNFSFRT
jgi:hypothetical protein